MADPAITLEEFLDDTGLDLDDLYGGNKCWSDLREAAGLDVPVAGVAEVPLRRAIGRLLHIDDDLRLRAWRDWLATPTTVDMDRLPVRDRRVLRMLVASVVDQALDKHATLDDGWSLVVAHVSGTHRAPRAVRRPERSPDAHRCGTHRPTGHTASGPRPLHAP